MNKEESLELLAKGREAWNEWANKKIAERKALEEASHWNGDKDSDYWNEQTIAWHADAVADFSEHEFAEDVNFEGLVFPGLAQFHKASFKGRTRFGAASFGSYAGFREASFRGDASFEKASFQRYAWFEKASFTGDAWFNMASFERDASFEKTSFHGITGFNEASFQGNAWFNEASFKGSGRFAQTMFSGYTEFDDAEFKGYTSFRAVDGQGNFSLAEATFLRLPDFAQAHFNEAPRLDNIHIEPGRLNRPILESVRPPTQVDDDRSARWQALKRLAIQGHDHVREQEFFKQEVISRRWTADRLTSAAFWVGVLYEILSDFGRSMARPLMWWAAGVVVFAFIYIGAHKSVSEQPQRTSHIVNETAGAASATSCIDASGNVVWAVFGLSIRNGLVLPGISSTRKQDQIYRCLFGTENRIRERYDRPVPWVPDGVAAVGVLQNIYSAVLIFLFLLAVRNHFRIK